MSYTLCVIDAQPYFEASSAIKISCSSKIKKAIADKAAIIFVEYRGFGKTMNALTKIVKDAKYKKTTVMTKDEDDGGRILAERIKKRGYPSSTIKICGVNTDCCVYRTVKTLIFNMPKSKIHVLEKACNSDFNHKDGIKRLSFLNNVNIKKI